MQIEFKYIPPEDMKSAQSGKPFLFMLGLSALLVIAFNLIPKDNVAWFPVVLFLSFVVLLLVISILISLRNARQLKRKLLELTYSVVLDDSYIRMTRIAQPNPSITEEWANVIGMKATKHSEVVTAYIGARGRVWYYGCTIQIRNKEPLVFNEIEKNTLKNFHEAAKSHNIRLENASHLES